MKTAPQVLSSTGSATPVLQDFFTRLGADPLTGRATLRYGDQTVELMVLNDGVQARVELSLSQLRPEAKGQVTTRFRARIPEVDARTGMLRAHDQPRTGDLVFDEMVGLDGPTRPEDAPLLASAEVRAALLNLTEAGASGRFDDRRVLVELPLSGGRADVTVLDGVIAEARRLARAQVKETRVARRAPRQRHPSALGVVGALAAILATVELARFHVTPWSLFAVGLSAGAAAGVFRARRATQLPVLQRLKRGWMTTWAVAGLAVLGATEVDLRLDLSRGAVHEGTVTDVRTTKVKGRPHTTATVQWNDGTTTERTVEHAAIGQRARETRHPGALGAPWSSALELRPAMELPQFVPPKK